MPLQNEKFQSKLPPPTLRPLPDPLEQERKKETPATPTAINNNNNNQQASTSTPIDISSSSSSSITDEYAQPIKHVSSIDPSTSSSISETTKKTRANTTGKLQQKQGSPLLRSNSEASSANRKSATPPVTDVVYQHTTSVVKSVIELNTGVQHAQPEEFVDLVKVFLSVFHNFIFNTDLEKESLIFIRIKQKS